MNKSLIKLCSLSLFLFFNSAIYSAMPDLDWVHGIESIHESDKNSPQVGTRWGLASRKDDVQLTFKLEANNDLSLGGWLGDVRTNERFYITLNLYNKRGYQLNFDLDDVRALGPDSEYGVWKDGPATSEMQSVMFVLNWDLISRIRDAEKLVMTYASYDSPDEKKNIVFPLATFKTHLTSLEASIHSVRGGEAFLLTQAELESRPIKALPKQHQVQIEKELSKIAQHLGRSVSDLRNYSMLDIKAMQKSKSDEERAARRAQKQREHQAIYDQEPDWLALNKCPNRTVSGCNNIGKQAHEKKAFIGEPFHFGKIIGVVWRPVDSIIKIYGGSISMNIDPEIYRAKKAAYYYIIKNKSGYLELVSVAGVTAK